MSTIQTKFITAAEFLEMEDLGSCELVRGEIVFMNPPGWRHGNRATKIISLLDRYLELHDVGRLSALDAGVVTGHEPDTVRGADICFHSYVRLPDDLDPHDYPEIAPEIVWEVLSPTDRWKNVAEKVEEYLQAGVLVVCVVDPVRECCVTYAAGQPERRHVLGEVWSAGDILPGFELPLELLFRKGRRPTV